MATSKKIRSFPTEKLNGFAFGDPDAKTDDILQHCPQAIRGVNEFLTGGKSIVLGERGVGKSALFRLLAEGKFKFSSEEGERSRRSVIVAIDEDLDYLAIANTIDWRFSDTARRPHGKYRFLWELYIMCRIVESLRAEEDDEAAERLHDEIRVILGSQKLQNLRLMDLLKRMKVTASTKVDVAGSVTPALAVEAAQGQQQRELSDKEIAELRNRVRKAIRSRRFIVTVLVDKIDDFVVGMEYREQKKSIQALIECTQSMRFPELKLKIFLRADIFRRLDFEKIGFDKISTQVVQLEWTPEDICGLVGRRLMYNYELLDTPRPQADVSLALLSVEPKLVEAAKTLFASKWNGPFEWIRLAVSKNVAIMRILVALFQRKSHSERKTNFVDEILLSAITFIFPTRMPHLDSKCARQEMPVKDYFASHFALGGHGPNPRLVIIFLTYVLEEAVLYYKRNPDPACRELPENSVGEFELILKEHIIRAYARLQKTARETISQLNSSSRPFIQRLFSSLGKPSTNAGLSHDTLKKLTQWSGSEDEFIDFIAFFTHVGLFVVDDETVGFERRKYSIPTLLRVCKHAAL